MKNERGQALIEFILIVPVLALFILGIFDIGNIIYKKYQLENDLDYIIDLYEADKNIEITSYSNKQNIQISKDVKSEYTTITLNKQIKFVTPGLDKIFKAPYSITTSRTIVNE